VTGDRWDEVEHLLHAARRLAPGERVAFVQGIGDAAVRAEVNSLLAADSDGRDIGAVIGEAAQAVLDDPSSGQIIAHFRVLRLLGRGGMGEVYLAEDPNLGRKVALKLLPSVFQRDSERVRRLEREARAAAALNHPNIVTMYEIAEWRGQSFIAMEFVEGETLAQRLSRGPLTMAEGVRAATQMACALVAAHQAGVIHRDLKPANVMLRADGAVKVLDFGLARLLPHSGDSGKPEELPMATATGRVMGTPAYMAPEQWNGQAADARSDIYAFGCVLYELLTGRRATVERKPLDSSELERIVSRCLQPDPADRWQSAADLLLQLERARSGRTRWRGVGIVAGLAVLACVGFLVWPRSAVQALTDKDVVILADFANNTGDTVFDGTLRQALALHLEQSPFLQIMEDAVVRHDLRLMGRSPGERITSQTAQDICVREAAAATIEGSIASLGKSYAITVHAVTCPAGTTLAREQTQAEDKEHVLQALAKAATAMRAKLGESLASVEKTARPFDQYTTTSLEAHRNYALGHAELAQGRPLMAISLLQRATELDPRFAMAHYYLAVALTVSGQIALGNESMRRAFALIDCVSEYERLIISARYYWRVTGELNRAVDTFELTMRSYPRWYGAPNQLGGLYATSGEFEKSLEQYLIVLRLAPRVEIAYRNLASVYIRLDRLDEAKQIIERARAQQLDTSRLHQRLLEIAELQNDQAAAVREMQWYTGKPDEYDALAVRANHADALGRRKDAEELYVKAVAAARRRGVTEAAERFENTNALAQALNGECKTAKRLARPALALVLCGDFVQAEKLVAEASRMSPNGTLWNAVERPAIRAAIDLRRDQPARSIERLASAVPYERAYPEVPYLRGLAYQRVRKNSEAAAEFRKILDHKGANWGVFYSLAGSALARAAAVSETPLR
jgi:eukaryotic-like serine/threonine-protein kinase